MDTQEPTNLIINTYPTPKEQLIAGAIGLAITAGSAVVIFGGFALVGVVSDKITKRRKSRIDEANVEINKE